MKGQERGRLQDISDFEIDCSDVNNLIRIKKFFNKLNLNIEFVKYFFHENDEPFINPYPGFENIYDDFEWFFNKFKIKYKEDIYDSDSDSDSDSF